MQWNFSKRNCELCIVHLLKERHYQEHPQFRRHLNKQPSQKMFECDTCSTTLYALSDCYRHLQSRRHCQIQTFRQ